MSQGSWRRMRLSIPAVAGVLFFGAISEAANTWDGGATPNSNWSAANNWDNNLVPTFPAQLTFGGAVNLSPNNDLGNVPVDGIIFAPVGGSFTIGGQDFTLGSSATADFRRHGISNSNALLQTVANNFALSRGQHHISTTAAGGLTLSGAITRNTGAAAYFAPIAGTNIKTTQLSNGPSGIIGGWAVIQNPTPDPLRPNETAAFYAKVDGSGNVVPYGDADYAASGGGTAATNFDIDGDAGETMLPSPSNFNTNVRWQGAVATGFDLTLPSGTTDMNTFLYDAPQFYPPGTTNGSETVQIGANTLRFNSGGGIFRSNNTGVNANPANDAGITFASTAAAIVGDYNNDGDVNAGDYAVWREAQANAATTLVNREPAQTGLPVDQVDYDAWKTNFGKTRIARITAGNSSAPAELVIWTNTATNASPTDPGDQTNRIVDLVNTVITNNPDGGAVTVIKNGPGAVRTSNTGGNVGTIATSNVGHSFTGGLYLNRGVWRSDLTTNANQIARGGFGAGPVYVATGAQAFPQTSQTVDNDFFVSGTGIDEGDFEVGAIRANNANIIFNGTINLTANARIGARGGQATSAAGTGARFNGKITGNFALELNMGTDQGTANPSAATALTGNMPTMILNNSGNDYTGDTTIGRGRIRLGTSEVIPDGAGKGNLVIRGEEDFFTAPAVQAASSPSVLSLDNATETVNGLISAGTMIDPINGGDLAIITNSKAGTATLRVGNNNASSTYSGVIIDDTAVTGGPGVVKLVKIGSGTLTLNGDHNAYSGDTNVEGGKLTITTITPYLADLADVRVLTGAQLELNFAGTDFIDSLFLGGAQVVSGEWGSMASTAPNKSALLLGLGTLFVQTGPGSGALAGAIPEPVTMGLIVVAGLFGIGTRSRKRSSM